jgi:hypothetical protein
MKLAISRERLREKIMSSPDVASEAGINTGGLENILAIGPQKEAVSGDEALKLKEAFGVFVRQIRRRERLTVAELSTKGPDR